VATTTNFGWTTPDNTGYVKDGALAIRTLGSAIDTSMAELKGGTTGQVLKKTSGTDMDFEWGTVSSTPRIGQVVTTTTTNSTTSSGTGWTDVSGLSVTITPTLSTSKILISTSFYTLAVSGTPPQPYAIGWARLIKGSSTELNSAFTGTYYPSGGNVNTAAYGFYAPSIVDSPASTSAITYKAQISNIFGIQAYNANEIGASIQIRAMEILV
jgi:hypothetical protein